MFTIRRIAETDRSDWLRMRVALWPAETEAHAPDVDRFFRGPRWLPLEVLLAVDGSGAVVGFAELSIRSVSESCESDRVGYLEGWYVEPHARRCGVGRALVEAAEVWARAQGCTEFGSDTEIDNVVSRAAHRALGFEETAEIRCFRKVLDAG